MTVVRWEGFEDDVERRLPELAPRFAQARPLWEGEPIPPHIVLGDIILPALVEALANRDLSQIERLVDLLTLLAESTDDRLTELVMVSFVEFVLGDKRLEERLQRHLSSPLHALFKQRKSWKPGNPRGSRS